MGSIPKAFTWKLACLSVEPTTAPVGALIGISASCELFATITETHLPARAES